MKIRWANDPVIETEYQKDKNSESFSIIANKDGLISLANILMDMSKDEMYSGYHVHLDEHNSFEKGSVELILIRK